MILPGYKHRNELRFYVPGLAYHARLLAVFSLWLAGLAVQAALGWLWMGAAVIFAGTVFALARGYSNEPGRAVSGPTRWENASFEQLKRILALDRESLQWDRAAWIDLTNSRGFAFAVIAALAVFLATRALYRTSAQLATVCLLDSVALFAPFWITGIRHVYHRTELMVRVGALGNVIARLNEPDCRGMTPVPMLELQKASEGDIPQDVKLMVRFDGAPDDFLGIQVQVSLNNVQGTKYPYLYCVILAKPGFGLKGWDYSVPAGWFQQKVTVEPKQTPEVELLVVRQETTKKSGYHTNAAAQRRVFDAAVLIAQRNLPRPS